MPKRNIGREQTFWENAPLYVKLVIVIGFVAFLLIPVLAVVKSIFN